MCMPMCAVKTCLRLSYYDFSTPRIQSNFFVPLIVFGTSANLLFRGKQPVGYYACVGICVTPLLTSTPCVGHPDVNTHRGPSLNHNGTTNLRGTRRTHLPFPRGTVSITHTATTVLPACGRLRHQTDTSAAQSGTGIPGSSEASRSTSKGP